MIRRRTPLQRRAWPRRRRPTPRRSERVRDPEYMARVRRLPCLAKGLGPCRGRVEADHAGRRPYGRKCGDDETIPMCSAHHRMRTSFSGPFRTWRKPEMRAWLDAAIVLTQSKLRRREPDAETVLAIRTLLAQKERQPR